MHDAAARERRVHMRNDNERALEYADARYRHHRRPHSLLARFGRRAMSTMKSKTIRPDYASCRGWMPASAMLFIDSHRRRMLPRPSGLCHRRRGGTTKRGELVPPGSLKRVARAGVACPTPTSEQGGMPSC